MVLDDVPVRETRSKIKKNLLVRHLAQKKATHVKNNLQIILIAINIKSTETMIQSMYLMLMRVLFRQDVKNKNKDKTEKIGHLRSWKLRFLTESAVIIRRSKVMLNKF